MFRTYPGILLSSPPFVLQVTKFKETCLQAVTIYYHRLGSLSTLRCTKTALSVPSLRCDSGHLQHRLPSAAASELDPSAKQQPSAWKQACFFFFFLAPLPTTVNHTARPHCAAWPTGTLAMATQIPADLAVKNRSSQKYERQESLIQFACMLFARWTKMSWSHD